MRRTAVALLCLTTLACQAEPQQPTSQRSSPAAPTPEPSTTAPSKPARKPAPKPTVYRPDLVAEVPPAPKLEPMPATELAVGSFEFGDGTDELVPRAAVAVRDGVLVVGQGYLDRQPGAPAQTRRWSGFVPSSGAPWSKLDAPGSIRAAVAHADGGLVTGTTGTDARGWFATVNPDGTLANEVALDSPSVTELFTLVAGQQQAELAVVGGYVDSQGWLVSLDSTGARRWEKFLGSVGYTQIRALARLDSGDLLAVGARSQEFGEAWFGLAPGDGGKDPSPADVVQAKVEITGADQNQILRVIVDVGDRGYVALGTAKRKHLQAHDQLLAVGFDRAGAVTWSRALDGVRVTDVFGVQATDAGVRGLVAVPIDDEPRPASALALVDLPVDPNAPDAVIVARQLADTDRWSTAGFVEAAAGGQWLAYRASSTGIEWRLMTASQ